ncbi:uncharacterized protein FOMMEDRAFT_106237 [Fomitiporia mediterranea MF3/22]|uniref:uncharacterized protein n=1 Tax=Fomitiporia mediterranea (strain MF3/22) TaxID=694068 RepID=UPI0004408D12|nr:uncharacterized protein FOMMEDRAFT_106237 [Fomitiporia mediterranea MF3/22]EJD03928.1 hypothetical protein FOMMEDRAFT_106237 [Fomitiporia mediterranea MF3/22]
MSLALNPLRASFFPLANLAWRPTTAWAVLRPAALLSPFHLAIPSWNSLLELFPPILWAVPKKKVSHSRKAMRSAHKGLKDKSNIVSCPGCGSAKLAHNICPKCYSQINRDFKRKAREAEDVEYKS